MGQLTVSQILTQGLAKGGRPDLTTPATTELQAWLRARASDWPWPQLVRRESDIALAAGTTSQSFGNGSTVTAEVLRILDPLFIYTSTFTTKGKVRVRSLLDGSVHEDEDANNSSTGRGQPFQVKVRADTSLGGKWTLIFFPVPDRAYQLAIDYLVLPADPTSGQKPWYPNDLTMIQAVKCFALDYAKQYDILGAEREVLSAMLGDDKFKFGTQDGWQDNQGLDTRWFRNGGGIVRRQWPPTE
jgi:hypothetical protein